MSYKNQKVQIVWAMVCEMILIFAFQIAIAN